MTPSIQLISTDFDGTLHTDFEDPAVPLDLQAMIADLQGRGTRWVINTGRDLSGVMEGMARARLTIQPDFLVTVEREIFIHDGARYVSHAPWNARCHDAHEELFARVRPQVPRLTRWVTERFRATIYEDSHSPFCLIAGSNADADRIQEFIGAFCATLPGLVLVRNDVYARFSHTDFNKGTALSEIGRLLGVPPERTLAAGDHLNDLPMLSTTFAHYLVAPSNAVPEVKEAVRRQHGYISHQPCGHGVARGLEFHLDKSSK